MTTSIGLSNVRGFAPVSVPDEALHIYMQHHTDQLKEIERAYLERDWVAYVLLHNGPSRMFAFIDAEGNNGLQGEDYWEVLSITYQSSFSPGSFAAFFQRFFKADIPPGRESIMRSNELEVYRSLPPEVTIYRGAKPEYRYGMSWTLSKSVAWKFKKNWKGQLYRTVIPKEAVLVYYNDPETPGNGEEEIVVDLDYLDVKNIILTK